MSFYGELKNITVQSFYVICRISDMCEHKIKVNKYDSFLDKNF